MKKLNKKDCIELLKKIVDKLEYEEIKYDIPLVHMDKWEFTYINILIPDHIPVYDITTLFSTQTIKEKEAVIYTTIDNFSVIFIKSSEKDWGYKFHYYSWNVLHVFIDILAYNSFSLRYTTNGLKYSYRDKWINITSNMKNIFDFLEIEFKILGLGFITNYSIYNYMENSPYFDSSYFTMENFKKFDPMFEYNESYYKDYLKRGLKIVGEKKDMKEQVEFIDGFFTDIKFLEQLSLIMVKEDFSNTKELIGNQPKVKSIPISDVEKYKILAEKKEKELLLKKKKIKIDPHREDDDLKLKLED